MKILLILKCDLQKCAINIGFLGSVLITAVLCFSSNGYFDSMTEKTFSVFEVALTFDRSLIASDYRMSSIMLFRGALSGYAGMFLPILSSFPFVMSFCTERASGTVRAVISRTGKTNYYFGKFISALISGGISVALGVLLYGAILRIVFPSVSEYAVAPEMLDFILPDGEAALTARTVLNALISGISAVVPAFFLSSFCKNPYIITCVPFLLAYIRDTLVTSLVSTAVGARQYEAAQIMNAFSTSAFPYLAFCNELGTYEIITLIVNLLFITAAFLCFIFLMNKRIDAGT